VTAATQTTPTKTTSQRPEAFAKLEQAIEQACSAGGWRAYLTAQARFHRYSFRNLLLILQQNPNASRVAGFHDWLKHSRCAQRRKRDCDSRADEMAEARQEHRRNHVRHWRLSGCLRVRHRPNGRRTTARTPTSSLHGWLERSRRDPHANADRIAEACRDSGPDSRPRAGSFRIVQPDHENNHDLEQLGRPATLFNIGSRIGTRDLARAPATNPARGCSPSQSPQRIRGRKRRLCCARAFRNQHTRMQRRLSRVIRRNA
jgi:hypothetical protein